MHGMELSFPVGKLGDMIVFVFDLCMLKANCIHSLFASVNPCIVDTFLNCLSSVTGSRANFAAPIYHIKSGMREN